MFAGLLLLALFFTGGSPLRAEETNPNVLYHDIWQLVDEHFYYRDRLVNWKKYERPAASFSTCKEAEEAINARMQELNDPYTQVIRLEKTDDEAVVSLQANYRKGNIAYIPIANFDQGAAMQLKADLKRLNRAQSYIIDLRSNPGGRVKEALRCFELLSDGGVFTRLSGYKNSAALEETYEVTAGKQRTVENDVVTDVDRLPNLSGKKQMIVLVDEDTASAAEMLADALQGCKRAKLLGVKTFGKGVAQVEARNGPKVVITVTFAQWLRADGQSIHGIGIVPDISVVRENAYGDSQLREAVKLLSP